MRLTCLLLFVLFLFVPLAFGTPLVITGFDTQSIYANLPYEIQTGGGGAFSPGQVGFYTGSAHVATNSVTSGVFSFNLVNTLPGGSTLNSALLDLSFLLPRDPVSWAVTYNKTGTWAYVPAFSSTAGGDLFLQIQSGAVSHTVSASSVTGLDLLSLGFGTPLEAGNNLTVSWSQSLTFSADNTGYGGGCDKCEKYFSVWQDVTADGVLTLDYTPIPEPASMLLLGGGLVALGWWLKKRKRA